jgi:hypothetical protein
MTVVPAHWGSTPLGQLGAVLLIAYLAVYLVWAGPLTSRSWARGVHASPEHWTYHLLLERVGFIHHHGPGQDASPVEHGPAPEARAGLPQPPSAPQLVAPGPSLSIAPDGILYQFVQAPSGVSAPTSVARLGLLDDLAPPGLRPEPAEQPPRSNS